MHDHETISSQGPHKIEVAIFRAHHIEQSLSIAITHDSFVQTFYS